MEFSRPRQQRQGVFSTLRTVVLSCLASAPAWAAGPRIDVNIPAGDAARTIHDLIDQAKLQSLFLVDQLAGITTNPVAGKLEVTEALEIMLHGTGVRYTFDERSRFVSFERPEPQEVGTAEHVEVAQAAIRTQSSMTYDEAQRLRYQFGSEPDLSQVVITGTRIRGVMDIMSPLEVVPQREIKKAPYATIQDVMKGMPLNSGSGWGEDPSPTTNFMRGTAANLRGLGEGATLVLVNGRRQPYSGLQGEFVDLSGIPASIVDRVEVLPDGASATYGSDAIAGVVNIITRTGFEGWETQLRGGTALGGASERLFSQLFGTQWEGGGLVASYQYADRSRLQALDRAYAATTDKSQFGGDDLRTYLSSPGNVLDPRTLTPAYGIGAGGLEQGNINLYNRNETIDLLPDRQSQNVYFMATQKLGDRIELFAEGRFGKRGVEFTTTPSQEVLVVPRSNPFVVNPFAPIPFTYVGYNFVNDLGSVEIDADSRAYTGSTGIGIDVGDSWRVTASGSYGVERMRYTLDNAVDLAALAAALRDPNPETAFDPIGGRTNPSTLNAIRGTRSASARSALTAANVVADGTLMNWSTGAVRLAVGGEWRKEELARGVNGVTTESLDRDINSLFAELSAPLIGDAGSPRATPRLELSLAARYEQYSDFGKTLNPKVGLKWAPLDSLKLRTSWGTSFRAPKLFDVYSTSLNGAAIASLRDPASPSGMSLVLGVQGSNPDLEEELASTWTAGIDLMPSVLPDLRISITYYSIDYKDRVGVPGPSSSLDILLHEDQWRDVITRDPTPAQIAEICDRADYSGSASQCKSAPIAALVDLRMRNLSSLRTHGVDFKVDQDFRSSWGAFQFGINGNYSFNFEQRVSSLSPSLDLLNTVDYPLAFRLRGTADWYQRRWDLPGFGVNLTVDHRGGYQDLGSAATRGVSAFTVVDLRTSFRTSSEGPLGDVEFALNASNVLNDSPPFVNREAGYDVINFDPYGRIVSLSLQKTW